MGALTLIAASGPRVEATSLNWAGYTWTVSPYAIGDGTVSSNASNTWVDGSGYLHLDLAKIGSTWYGAEVATTNNFGYGSFYWVFSAPLTSMQAQDVLAGFTYGPDHSIGVGGENELDVEFSKWGHSTSPFNGDFTFYPSTGHAGSGSNLTNWAYTGGNIATCRVDWSATSVTGSIWNGVVASNAPLSTAAITWNYKGNSTTVPQDACPFLFNIWASGTAPTTAVDAVVQSFQYTAASAIVPAPPVSLASAGANGQVALTWVNTTFATSYNVYRGTTAGGESGTPIATGVTSASYIDTGRTNGTVYYYKVAAVDAAGTSGMSGETSATPTTNAANLSLFGTGYVWSKNASATSNANQVANPSVNDSLAVTFSPNWAGEGGSANYEGAGVVWPITYTMTSVNFTNGADDGHGNGWLESNCQLQFTTDGTTWTNSGWVLTPTYPATSAAYNQTYTFSGTARSGVRGARVVGAVGGNSYDWTVKEVQIYGTGSGPTPPPAPTGLTATAGNQQIALSWGAASGATSYNVYRGTTSGGEGTTPIATGLAGTTYTNTGLTNGTTYYYKVAAVNSGGTSGPSNEVPGTPTGSTNIAPSGTGYTWASNTTATSNSNRTARPGVNDNNLTTSNVMIATGEGGAVKWEGGGVVWTAAHTVSQVVFINGGNDGFSNGWWQSGFALQYSTDGTTWVNASGWTSSPAYPYSSSAWGQTYTFNGTALSGVKGIRVVGASGGTSYSGSVNEVKVMGS